MTDGPFEWWEYDTAGTQVLPVVVGPEIPYIPVSEVERCEMAAYESLAQMMADEEAAQQEVAEAQSPSLAMTLHNLLPVQLIESFVRYLLYTPEGNTQLAHDPELAEQVVEMVRLRRL